MEYSIEKTTTVKLTVNIQDGFYKHMVIPTKVYCVKGKNVIMVDYEETLSNQLLLTSKIEIISFHLFARLYYLESEPCTEKFFKQVLLKVIDQTEKLL
jgi:hypothetical protein